MINELKVNNIILRYLNNNPNIERIREIIERNKILFSPFEGKIFSLGIQDGIGIYINSFYQFFKENLISALEEEDVLSTLKEDDLLVDVYISILNNNCCNRDLFDDVSYFLTACRFYGYNKDSEIDKLVQSLITHEDEDLFLEFLLDTELFNSYNYCLDLILKAIKEYDIPYFDDPDEIKRYIIEEMKKVHSDKDIPFDSKEVFTSKFLGFLKWIHAPKEWYFIFRNLKIEDSRYNVQITESCYNEKLNQIHIHASGGGDYFIAFVHEFIHCISKKGGKVPFPLNEFAPIFYEKLASYYLIEIGYDKNTIEGISSFRSKNNYELFFKIRNILVDLYEYSKKGSITKEDKLKRVKLDHKTANIIIQYINSFGKNMENFDINVNLDEGLKNIEYVPKSEEYYLDLLEEKILKNMFLFFDNFEYSMQSYIYIINSYMADNLIKKKDEETLDKMIHITNYLYQYDVSSLLQDLKIDDIFGEKKEDKIKYKKK